MIPIRSIIKKLLLLCLISSLLACASAAAKRADGIAAIRTSIASGTDINKADPDSGRTLLHDAVSHQSPELVLSLIEKGANVNAPDKGGCTPLALASQSNNKQITGILISKGADLNSRDIYGYTALLWSLYYDFFELAKTLIEKGADVNIAEDKGKTPLMFACEKEQIELAGIMISKGADVCAFDASGCKASDYVRFTIKPSQKDSNPVLYGQKAGLLKELKELEIRQFAVTVPPYATLLKVVQKVSQCLNPDIDYAVFISNKDQINAWVNVAGNITFTQKALDAWDEDTLTLVAAHEIAHDKLGHVAKKMSVSYTTSAVMSIAGYIVPGLGLLNLLANPAITNNYGKTQEYEADKLAAESCSRCFGMTNERQLQIMRAMRDESKGDGGGFFSSHPAWNDRIENIRKE